MVAIWFSYITHNVRLGQKLQKSWERPYKVVKQINYVVYRIQIKDERKQKMIDFNRSAFFAGNNSDRIISTLFANKIEAR